MNGTIPLVIITDATPPMARTRPAIASLHSMSILTTSFCANKQPAPQAAVLYVPVLSCTSLSESDRKRQGGDDDRPDNRQHQGIEQCRVAHDPPLALLRVMLPPRDHPIETRLTVLHLADHLIHALEQALLSRRVFPADLLDFIAHVGFDRWQGAQAMPDIRDHAVEFSLPFVQLTHL